MALDGFLLSDNQPVSRSLKYAWQSISGDELVLSSDAQSAVEVLRGRQERDNVIKQVGSPLTAARSLRLRLSG